MKQGLPVAIFGNSMATNFVEATSDVSKLDDEGWWAVTHTFEGDFQAFRFSDLQPLNLEKLAALGHDLKHEAIATHSWTSSMTRTEYVNAVDTIRQDIARGWVYQANLCRVLTTHLTSDLNVVALWSLLSQHNPAPYLSALQIPASLSGLAEDVRVVSASPELFLSRKKQTLRSSPIKGTAKVANDLLEKDQSENIMIVDLVRNDLGQVCESGSVNVVDLLRLEQHPGLVHLVSDVEGTLPADTSWSKIFSALLPPGSVSGAPKSSALEVIQRLENGPRGIYCGGFGWVNSDDQTAELAVGIRTFWQSRTAGSNMLHFGTGAGITWASDPVGEWNETELKAERLLQVAAMSAEDSVDPNSAPYFADHQ
ncbi:MAG: anthranilate synthase component I family protein [Actinobacteria bacterium]|jgi:para-aminobenzoate synthetase component 1|nr:anthranilate synthase component I family protein [Actinomycetota bacterium]NBO34510.1 anthranilate synthase component I family protein [Actinomycetota bacterium]